MQKSLIERVFPKSKRTYFADQDERSSLYRDDEQELDLSPSPARIALSDSPSLSRSSRRSSESRSQLRSPQPQLRAAPISASVIHHDDPFLAVDRAAANLQKTIQSLLDFQSQALSGRHQSSDQDEVSSQRSDTPNHSTVTRSVSSSPSAQRSSIARATPVRQPRKKRTTLRGARRGLLKSMQEFATLKEEELKITDSERIHRTTALDRVSDLETKREAVRHEIHTLKERANGIEIQGIRAEATAVEEEIHELEGRLMELKARHRHLIDRATQLDNTAASELSSYEGTLAAIDKETRSFLRRPPVKQSLGPRSLAGAQDQLAQDMFALRPERRTLDIAKEQWTAELDILHTHKTDIERDRQALLEGAEVWNETVDRIDAFETTLRDRMKSANTNSVGNIVEALDSTMLFLHGKISQAESRDWKLLLCAIGAEFEAFQQARALLAPNEPLPEFSHNHQSTDNVVHTDEEDSDIPHADLLGGQSPELTSSVLRGGSDGKLMNRDNNAKHDSPSSSNESLKATLRNFQSDAAQLGDTNMKTSLSSSARREAPPAQIPVPARKGTTYSESEDDDPGPDFLISHS